MQDFSASFLRAVQRTRSTFWANDSVGTFLKAAVDVLPCRGCIFGRMIGEWYFRVRSRAFGILKNFEVCRACVGPFRTETRLQFHSSLSRRPPLRPTLAPAPFFTIVTISFAQITALLSQRSTTHTEHALTTCVQNASQCVHAHTTITTCVNLSSCTSVKARAHAAGLSRAGRRASTCFLSRCVALEGAGLCRAGGSSHSEGVGREGCSEGVGLEG